jgi:oligopeptidase B
MFRRLVTTLTSTHPIVGRSQTLVLKLSPIRGLSSSGIKHESSTNISQASDNTTPPLAERIPHVIELHGRTLTDDYFWLRERTNPKVIQYLQAESKYFEEKMKPLRPLQEKLYQEILRKIKQTDLTVPYKHGPYFYYQRTVEGLQYRLHCRKSMNSDHEEVILDENELAKGKSLCQIGVVVVSPDHNILAYSDDYLGNEHFTVHFKDLRTGKLYPETLSNVDSVAWNNDNKTVYYVTLDHADRPYKVWRHTVGTDPALDTLLYHETDERFRVSVARSSDGQYVVVDVESRTTTEVHLINANVPNNTQLQLFFPRRHGIEYRVVHQSSRFFVLTNEDAINNKVMEVADTNLNATFSTAHWRLLVPHNSDIKLERLDVFENHLVIWARDKGTEVLLILNTLTGETHRIAMSEAVYTLSPQPNKEFSTNIFRFAYSSPITPYTVFDYDMNLRTKKVLKVEEVLDGYDPTRYHCEKVYVYSVGQDPSASPVSVPVSIIYRKDRFKKDGSNPTLLYGYGAYELTSIPEFSHNRFTLLDRGFVYAYAHIRGGGELGRKWYEDGKLFKKKNTFYDFIAVAEYLIKEKYTSSSRLTIEGASAGGLLMGAVVTMRPELFKAALIFVPFVDVINTMLDPTLPLTVNEFEEWGNPLIKEHFEYMLSYSPYDNIRATHYPSMFVTTGFNDPRVCYWEPVKFVAKLRALKKDNNLLLLKAEMTQGHYGSSGRYDHLREVAEHQAFLLDQVGINE